MANDSASGGFLAPSTDAPPQELDLDEVFQQAVAGITGLPGVMVRPRVQPNNPLTGQPVTPIPNADTDWCAVSVTATVPDGGARGSLVHNGDGDGTSTLRRQEMLRVLASFYGPHSHGYATLLRDGLTIGQNTETLFFAGIRFVDATGITAIPDLVNGASRRRQDITFRFRRSIVRTYPIRNLVEADGTFHTETHDQNWSTES